MAGVALLAGPIFLLAGTVWFWVHAGTLEWIDHLLLWNLWLAAGVGWVYLLIAIEHRGSLRDAHAQAVRRLIFPPRLARRGFSTHRRRQLDDLRLPFRCHMDRVI